VAALSRSSQGTTSLAASVPSAGVPRPPLRFQQQRPPIVYKGVQIRLIDVSQTLAIAFLLYPLVSTAVEMDDLAEQGDTAAAITAATISSQRPIGAKS
jgi:hypothetical protein